MSLSRFSESEVEHALLTLESVQTTIDQLMSWNQHVRSTEDYYASQSGMQLLAANCTLITAIGEGVNRINRILPEFLPTFFPEIPWRAVIGMRNHIAHGYFELDADIVLEAIKTTYRYFQIPLRRRSRYAEAALGDDGRMNYFPQ